MQNAIRGAKMQDMKQAKSFRLSSQSVERLERLEELTGSNRTAIVEMSLAMAEMWFLVGQGKDASHVTIPLDLDLALTAWDMGVDIDWDKAEVQEGDGTRSEERPDVRRTHRRDE